MCSPFSIDSMSFEGISCPAYLSNFSDDKSTEVLSKLIEHSSVITDSKVPPATSCINWTIILKASKAAFGSVPLSNLLDASDNKFNFLDPFLIITGSK